MAKMILISDEDLKGLIQEAVTNAVDGITKKIAANAAVRFYNNEIFNPSRTSRRSVTHYDEPPCSCGSSGGGCGSTSPSGGCGGGYTRGGC